MTTDPTRCPYGEMEWFCALAPGHDGPHRSDDLSSPVPDRDHGGTPGWRERLAEYALDLDKGFTSDIAVLRVYQGPQATAEGALAADLRAALAASSPGVVTTDLLTRAFDRAASVEFSDDALHAAASSPQEGGGGAAQDIARRLREFADELAAAGTPDAYSRGLATAAKVAADAAARLADAAPPPAGVQVDREAARRIRERLKNGPGCSFLRGCFCDFRLRERTHQEWLDHYDDALAAALAPLLGTPEP